MKHAQEIISYLWVLTRSAGKGVPLSTPELSEATIKLCEETTLDAKVLVHLSQKAIDRGADHDDDHSAKTPPRRGRSRLPSPRRSRSHRKDHPSPIHQGRDGRSQSQNDRRKEASSSNRKERSRRSRSHITRRQTPLQTNRLRDRGRQGWSRSRSNPETNETEGPGAGQRVTAIAQQTIADQEPKGEANQGAGRGEDADTTPPGTEEINSPIPHKEEEPIGGTRREKLHRPSKPSCSRINN
jgi:hypothetical protein